MNEGNLSVSSTQTLAHFFEVISRKLSHTPSLSVPVSDIFQTRAPALIFDATSRKLSMPPVDTS